MIPAMILVGIVASGCARTGLDREPPPGEITALPTPDVVAEDDAPDVREPDISLPDIELDISDVEDVITPDIPPDAPAECPFIEPVETGCVDPINSERAAQLCNGLDDDCDGEIDEGCLCTLGEVQSCFAGPPGRADAGACRRGTQRCLASGGWGDCSGGVEPQEERCDGLDNDCDGCVDEFVDDCFLLGSCPGPSDVRTPDGAPFEPYALDGTQFYEGPASAWRWDIEGGICDQLGATVEPSFDLERARRSDAVFTPRLSGAYTVRMTAETPSGPFECSWVVDVTAPGLRVEMCYPESSVSDIDLYMMPHERRAPWFAEGGSIPGRRYTSNPDACGWHNCEAALRGAEERVDWGYEQTGVDACNRGPQGDQWEALGFCANPRLDIDNNLQEGTGLPENINIDNPRDGDRFRVMVQNWSGSLAHPVVNVYCGGLLSGTFGAPPDALTGFEYFGIQGDPNAMWRAADIEMQVDADGNTTGCTVTAPRRPDGLNGYDVTYNNPRY